MIRQVTAGFLVTAAKTHLRAGPGRGAGGAGEMQDTADRPGLKQVRLLPLEEQGSAAASPAHFTWHPAQRRAGRGISRPRAAP